MADTNKIHYDLTNVFVAKATISGESVTYATPKRLFGAMSMDLSPVGDNVKLRADGTDYYTTISNNGYEGTLALAMVPDWFKQEILGETITETGKVLVENALVEPAHFALCYEFMYDKKKRRHVMYNCVAGRPNQHGENKDNQREADTEELSLTCSPLPNGNVKASTTEETPDTVYNNWTTAIWTQDA